MFQAHFSLVDSHLTQKCSQTILSLIVPFSFCFQTSIEIHVCRSEIPRPENVGPRPRRRRPLGAENPRPGIQRRGTPPRLAGCKPARPPGWRPVRRGEPRWFAGASPRGPFPRTREPGHWRPRFFGDERRSNWQRPRVWRSFPDAPERPSCCRHQGASLALAGGLE